MKGSVKRVKKSIVAVALAVIFVMALAAPAFAMTHGVTYEMDGVIDFRKQAGHGDNTGGTWKQTITGSGEMSKTSAIWNGHSILDVVDNNDFVAGETALTVTSVIELAMPPKYTYDGLDLFGNNATIPVHYQEIYGQLRMPSTFRGFADPVLGLTGGPWTPAAFTAVGVTHEQLARAYGWDALTDQIWAAQVSADPGFSGNLHQDFTAAHGTYVGITDWAGRVMPWGYDDWYDDDTAWSVLWQQNRFGNARLTPGPEYAGSFFDIEQMSRTSQGTVQRYIDVSSPMSGGYLHEDMSVVGKSEITEHFHDTQIPAGADAHDNWWDLF